MKSRIVRIAATASATALLAGAGAAAATSASADAAAVPAVAHSTLAPTSDPYNPFDRDDAPKPPPPDWCLYLLGLQVLCT
jgi:hypothetical protein